MTTYSNSIFAMRTGKARYAVEIDKQFPKSSYRLESYMCRDMARIQYMECDIYDTEFDISSNDVVVSIHPCRELAFRAIDIATDANVPITIVPCCVSKRLLVKSWMNDFVNMSYNEKWDLLVAEYLHSKNYDIHINRLPDHVTPRNCIITGTPI